ncbi:MAG: FAD:protein FMN transferase ApbE [Halobacteriovoraceae bacterium]|nr:FAD:protein FMN transferase ApbE [Halobacteriovoraceae bacterium]
MISVVNKYIKRFQQTCGLAMRSFFYTPHLHKSAGTFLLMFFFIACSSEKKFVSIEGKTMGTYYRVQLYSSESKEKLKADIDKFLRLFNQVFSTYIEDSEVSKINKHKFDQIKISDSMKKLIELSQNISRKSYGYYDPTVAPLVNLWGFGPHKVKSAPEKRVIEQAIKKVGFNKLEVKDDRLYYLKGMELDFSAIAKGYGVDELVKFLEYQGYANLLVEIGGELRARGHKADQTTWKVGIEGPNESLGASIIKVVPLKNKSMATSGSYRNYLKYGDKVFSHTIDPHTGMPVEHKTISVSVVHDYCADADAWATALMSMGAEKGLDIADKNGLAVFFQVKEGDKIVYKASSYFDKYLKTSQ